MNIATPPMSWGTRVWASAAVLPQVPETPLAVSRQGMKGSELSMAENSSLSCTRGDEGTCAGWGAGVRHQNS